MIFGVEKENVFKCGGSNDGIIFTLVIRCKLIKRTHLHSLLYCFVFFRHSLHGHVLKGLRVLQSIRWEATREKSQEIWDS